MCTARNGSKQEGNGLETNGTEWQGCGAWQDLCHLLHRKTKKGQRQERNAHSSATQSAISCRRSRISKGIGLEPPRQPRQWYKVYTEELKKRSHSHRLKLEWQLTHSEDFTVAIIPRSRGFTCPLFVRQPSQQVGRWALLTAMQMMGPQPDCVFPQPPGQGHGADKTLLSHLDGKAFCIV